MTNRSSFQLISQLSPTKPTHSSIFPIFNSVGPEQYVLNCYTWLSKSVFFHLSIVKRVSTISCSNIALRSATLHSNINLVLSFSHKAATRYGVNIALEPYNVALETQYNINTYRSTSEWQYQNKNKIYLKMVGWHEKMTGFMMSSITKEADAPNYSYIMLYTVLYSASYSASQSATKRHLALSILSLRYDGPEFWCQISAPLPYWSARALQP